MIKIKPNPKRPAVTDKLRATVTQPPSKRNGGRPKVHASAADRQRAYRKRKAAS